MTRSPLTAAATEMLLARPGPRASVEVEQVLEPDGEPGSVADGAQPRQHARGERGPVERVVPDREGLPRAAEDDLLVRDQAADPQRRAPGRRRRPPRGRPRDRCWWRRAWAGCRPRAARPRPAPPYAARCRTARRPCQGGAARRPRPTRRTGPPRRRSASSAPRRSRSSARPARPPPGASASHPRTVSSRPSSKPVVPTTAWMPCSMQKRRLSMTTSGWVKSTTASASAATRPSSASPTSTCGDQLEVVGRLDRAAHLGPDLALGAQHPDPSHRGHAHDLRGRVPRSGPRLARIWQG